MKKIVFTIIISLLSSLVILEVGLRIILPDYHDDEKYMEIAFSKLLNTSVIFDSSAKNYSKKFGFKLSPHTEKKFQTEEYYFTARTNSLGFRSKEIKDKNDNEYRVLLLGDSFIWGTGVNESDTVSSQLEHLGNQLVITHLPLSVYNYAVIGYNTVQEMLVLKNYAPRVMPDHVILGFFPGNDIISNALNYIDFHGNIASSHELIEKVKEDLRKSYSIFFYSIVFRILAVKTYVPKVRYKIATREEIIRPSYDLLKEFKRETQSLGARFSVVIIQPRDSVSGGLIQTWSNSRKVGDLISNFCRNNGIEVINMLDYMRGPEDMQEYFYQKDGHYNKDGNFMVAKVIFDQSLRDRIILEKRFN